MVARDEDDRRLGVLLEDLVRREVGERLCLIAVDRDVVDVEEVVLPDDRRGRLRDPSRKLVAALNRVAVAVLGPDVVGQGAANAFGVERVNGRRVLVEDVGDVNTVLQCLQAVLSTSVSLVALMALLCFRA